MKWAVFSSSGSGKREVATSLLGFWTLITIYVVLIVPHEQVVEYKEIYSSLTTAIFLWSGGAFGFEFAARSGLGGMVSPTLQNQVVRKQESSVSTTSVTSSKPQREID